MLDQKNLGINVIHLIYSLRAKGNSKENKDERKWERINVKDDDSSQSLSYYYHREFLKEHEKELKIKSVTDIRKYFHPNVQSAFFQDDNLTKNGIKVYRYSSEPRRFQGYIVNNQKIEIDNKIYQFEWLATELYEFGREAFREAFLVVRLSLDNEFLTKEGTKNRNTVQDWIRFVELIRMNHKKYDEQKQLIVSEVVNNKREENDKRIFFDYVQELFKHDKGLESFKIANRDVDSIKDSKAKEEAYRIREPNAFVHGYVEQDLRDSVNLENRVDGDPRYLAEINYWDIEEIYQILSVDPSPGDSGGTIEFQRRFVEEHTYTRWGNYGTVYAGIDYGIITLVTNKEEKLPTFNQTILYQNEIRLYLLMILMQLYYREEVQDIMGEIARLGDFSGNGIKDSRNARGVLNKYYNLNQYYYFDRLTNEIQGIELWEFYQKVLRTKTLFKTIQEDIRELNQRLIEFENRKQSKQIIYLTIIAGFTGLMGMNLLIDQFNRLYEKILESVAFAILLPFLLFLFYFIGKEPFVEKNWRSILLLIAFILFLIIYFLFGSHFLSGGVANE